MKVKILIPNRYCKENDEVELVTDEHGDVLIVKDKTGFKFSIRTENTDYEPKTTNT